jgi:hypothetical protein
MHFRERHLEVKKGGGSPWGKDYRLAAPHWGEPVPRVEPKLDKYNYKPETLSISYNSEDSQPISHPRKPLVFSVAIEKDKDVAI